MVRFVTLIVALGLSVGIRLATPAHAGQDPQQPAPQNEQTAVSGDEQPRAQSGRPRIRPYDQVITPQAVSDTGVFTVHRLNDRVYYEIPKPELGTDFLWVTQMAKTTEGVGYGGEALGNRVVRWERHQDRVLLKSVSYGLVADPSLPIAKAVEAANNETILMAFNIEALGPEDAPVIDVTPLLTTEITEFSARSRLRARGFDARRSFVERVVSFPENIETEATHTFTSPPVEGNQPPRPAGGMRTGSATVVVHYSMVKLPAAPMKPRLYDERVGYFSVRQLDYGRDEHRSPERRSITRWRLEKKDPNAELSEPVKPIVYWVDPATPTKWVPYVKRGIEKWQDAFEAAGFTNAIIAKEAPTSQEDPEWSAEDARYSVIRWLPSTVENAMGPHVHDPRTGEILEADIQFHHNVMNLVTHWYFVQAGAVDGRAQKLPLPDDLMGRLLEYVTAHEVGHTLGFQHNMKASSLYALDKIRDPDWLKTMGHTPTLMDYSRFNYVVQPEDRIDPTDLIPKIGPYDKWATMWGYKPIPSAATPDDERATLDAWARQQDATPWYRFSTIGSGGADAGELTEAVGDADAVRATSLGLKNLERVAAHLLTAATRPAEPYDDLEDVYSRLVGQWTTEMNHVAAIVGGFNSQQKHAGQNGVRFEPIGRSRQAEAVQFLNDHAFRTPAFLIKPEILRRIEPVGVVARIQRAQEQVLRNLLSSARFTRLVEQEALDGSAAYDPVSFLEAVRAGVWGELRNPDVRITAYRRRLQHTYLAIMDEKLNGSRPVANDERAVMRAELRSLDERIAALRSRAADRATDIHLADARDQIARALDPKFSLSAARPTGSGASAITETGDLVDESIDPSSPDGPLICWPDYAIRPE